MSVLGAESEGILNQFIKILSFLLAGALLLTVSACAETGYDLDSEAFAGCSSLTSAYIPPAIQSISADAFDDCPDDFLIVTGVGGGAVQYALNHTIDYKISGSGSGATQYRALVIGQNYATTPGWPLFTYATMDGATFADVLGNSGLFATTPFEVNDCYDLTASEILAQISSTFGSAGPEDVSLFYFSGHGGESGSNLGALVGSDGAFVTPTALRSAMDNIQGRKIIIISACFSGNHIAKYRDAAPGEYFVLTSSSATQESYGPIYNINFFTYHLLAAIGYDVETGTNAQRAADANGNGVLTLQEIYRYVYTALKYDENLAYNNHVQTCQVWPSGCEWFGVLRE